MKYVILLYSNPASRAVWAAGDPGDMRDALAAYAELERELTASGELVAAESLADGGVRLHALTPTDGPFAEAKEDLAGFFLVDCASMERAVEIAGRIPEAADGAVEVRPVRDLSRGAAAWS